MSDTDSGASEAESPTTPMEVGQDEHGDVAEAMGTEAEGTEPLGTVDADTAAQRDAQDS